MSRARRPPDGRFSTQHPTAVVPVRGEGDLAAESGVGRTPRRISSAIVCRARAIEFDVSVVIPTRDRHDLVQRAIASVRRQTLVPREIVLVDDGSRERGATAAPDSPSLPVVVVRHPKPFGVAQARNTGLGCARGEWVAFLDDDDVWAPTKLEQHGAALRERSHAEWSFCSAVLLDTALRPLALQRAEPPLPRLLVRNTVPGGGSGVVVRRTAALDAGGFDPRLQLLADWDLWIRLAVRSPALITPEVAVGYVVHDAAMTASARRLGDELAIIDAKHAALRRAHGVVPDALAWAEYEAWIRLRAGDRLPALRGYLSIALARRRPRFIVQAFVAPFGAYGWHLLSNRQRRRFPHVLRQEIEAWVAPLRAVPTR